MSNDNTDSNKYHGKPCVKCGETLRYRSNNNCVICARNYCRKWRNDNPEKERERNRKWRDANSDVHRQRSQKWREENPERNKELKHRWYKNNLDKCHESNKKSTRKWYLANKEIAHMRNRKRYWSNPEKYRARVRKWSKGNPEKTRARNNRRRAYKQKAQSISYDFGSICNHYGNKCLGCGRDDTRLTIDHVIPLSVGGPDIASNIQPLCQTCNSSKGTKCIDYRPDAGPERWVQRKIF